MPADPLTRADLHAMQWWLPSEVAHALRTTEAAVLARIDAGDIPARPDGRGRPRVHEDDVRRAGRGRAA